MTTVISTTAPSVAEEVEYPLHILKEPSASITRPVTWHDDSEWFGKMLEVQQWDHDHTMFDRVAKAAEQMGYKAVPTPERLRGIPEEEFQGYSWFDAENLPAFSEYDHLVINRHKLEISLFRDGYEDIEKDEAGAPIPPKHLGDHAIAWWTHLFVKDLGLDDELMEYSRDDLTGYLLSRPTWAMAHGGFTRDPETNELIRWEYETLRFLNFPIMIGEIPACWSSNRGRIESASGPVNPEHPWHFSRSVKIGLVPHKPLGEYRLLTKEEITKRLSNGDFWHNSPVDPDWVKSIVVEEISLEAACEPGPHPQKHFPPVWLITARNGDVENRPERFKKAENFSIAIPALAIHAEVDALHIAERRQQRLRAQEERKKREQLFLERQERRKQKRLERNKRRQEADGE